MEEQSHASLLLLGGINETLLVDNDRLNDGSQSVGRTFPKTAPPGVFRDISGSGTYRGYSQYGYTKPLCISQNDSEVFILAQLKNPIMPMW